MRNIKELRQAKADNEAAQAKLKAEGRKILGKLGSQRTDEQNARLDAIDAELETLTADLAIITAETAQAERLLDIERQTASAGQVGTFVPRGRRYAELFGNHVISSEGFSSREEFFGVLHSGLYDGRLRAAMTSATGGAGGFFVPTEYAAEMLDKSLESEIVRPRANVVPMNSDTRKIAGFDNLNHSGNSLYGGFEAVWLEQAGTATDQDAAVRMIELKARKLALFTRASNELVADGVSFEEQLGQAMVAAAGWGLDYACLRGTGAGQPLGVLNDPALVTVAKETGQAAATILYANLVKMFARLHPACVANSVWVANSTTIPQLAQLTIPIGTGGSHVPVLTESNGQFRILTRPVLFTEKLPAVGTVGDLVLVDFSQYTIGLRKEVSIEKSMHVGWQNDTSGYRVILRADGQGRWDEPFTPANGDSQSWCVALATRA